MARWGGVAFCLFNYMPLIPALVKLITDANDKNFQPRALDTNHVQIFCDKNSAQSVPHL